MIVFQSIVAKNACKGPGTVNGNVTKKRPIIFASINKYATEKFNMEQINNGIYVNTFNTVGIPKIIGSLILNKVGISATRDTLFICADLHINNMTINIAV